MEPRDIFISYIEEDGSIARPLANELRICGQSTWVYEEDGIPGISHLKQVDAPIKACRVFVLVASAASIHAPEVLAEVQQAHLKSKVIVPVRIGLTHQRFIDESDAIIRLAVGTAVSVSADTASISDTARRIAVTAAHSGPTTGMNAPTVRPRPAAEILPIDRGRAFPKMSFARRIAIASTE